MIVVLFEFLVYNLNITNLRFIHAKALVPFFSRTLQGIVVIICTAKYCPILYATQIMCL